MRRIEPTFGSSQVELAEPRVKLLSPLPQSKPLWVFVLDIIYNCALLAAVLALAGWLLLRLELVSIPDSIDTTNLPAKLLCAGGMILLFVVQLVAAVALLRRNPWHVVFALVTPGYALVALRRERLYWRFVVSYSVALLAVVAGMVMLA